MPDILSSPPSEPHFLSIAEAARLIARRQLSPVELTRALLARIEALDPQLNAYLLVTAERALDAAREAEAAIMAGRHLGPLHGIPLALKDVICTAGIRTTGHSRLCADYVPREDATVVRKLREAGAVLLGKLATHEFAHGGPSFDLPWPPARNPWNRAHATGGSSSGAGAAVAAGLALGALGTDTGGSIRNPAAMCGLVGLKPTYGLLSRHGVMTNSYSYDHVGPMAWTAEDCAILLQALAGYDPRDPASAGRPVPDYRSGLGDGLRGLRIGVLRHLHEEDVPIAPEAAAALEEALSVLRGLGAVLEEARIRPAQAYCDVKIVGAESELFAVHAENLRRRTGEFGEDFLGRALPAILFDAGDYVQSQRERRAMIAEMAPLYARFDAFVCAAPGPAPRLDAWRTAMFWRQPSLATPFNVLGGPALVQCVGFTADGLPLAMQIAGRPFEEATVLRIAHAYEQATPWRRRRPPLDPDAPFSAALPPVPDPLPAELDAAERDALRILARRAGLVLTERQFAHLCAAAPYAEAMRARLRRARDFGEEPASVFRFPAAL
ncbi:amidase [Caldovatus aquaticus]|uniref:Amidase n=1 Tax=Caldovatus aquaticus TaxID=2865671 RepID=A0ABS7F3A9_9PROT|nr:amidase [Caldovatus aquaticus]MBW8270092.1 amidase [Caldovatus aquaticus]